MLIDDREVPHQLYFVVKLSLGKLSVHDQLRGMCYILLKFETLLDFIRGFECGKKISTNIFSISEGKNDFLL